MYAQGTLVTLSVDKTYNDGSDDITLRTGTCGIVTRSTRQTDGNHQYVVDFGSYGGWYCMQNELDGDDTEGYDDSPEEDNDDREEPEEDPTPVPDPNTLVFSGAALTGTVFYDEAEEKPIIIDVEKDIARRMKELEKGEDALF